MQKTSNFNLKKPDVHDLLRVEDFNENAEKIDAALTAVQTLATAERVKMGSFVGTGVTGRTLELGFTPKFILIMSEMNSKAFVTIATPDFGLYMNSTDLMLTSSRVVEDGVYIAANGNNSSNGPNYYLAIL